MRSSCSVARAAERLQLFNAAAALSIIYRYHGDTTTGVSALQKSQQPSCLSDVTLVLLFSCCKGTFSLLGHFFLKTRKLVPVKYHFFVLFKCKLKKYPGFYRMNFSCGNWPVNVFVSEVNLKTCDEKKVCEKQSNMSGQPSVFTLFSLWWISAVWIFLLCAPRPPEASAAGLQKDQQCSELRENAAPLSREEMSLMVARLQQQTELRFSGCFLALVFPVTHE